MVLLHLLRRASNVVRTNVRNSTHKRLLNKKFEPLYLSVKTYSAYEGDGKTVGFIINKKNSNILLLSAVSSEGFTLSNGAELVGSIIIFPHSLMSWNVLNASEVTEESLSLFKLMEPKIDIIVFGYGSPNAYTREVRDNFQKICKKFGLRFEALPTEKAIGVYNFLADERRLVAGALIPPTSLSPFRYEPDSDIDMLEDLEEEERALIGEEKEEKKLLK